MVMKSILKLFKRLFCWEYLFYVVFAVLLFVKLVLFNYSAFQQILISSLWKYPSAFWGFYLPKLGATLFITSITYFCNRKWIALVVSFLIDIWIVANLMYIRSYNMVIDVFSITMVGNLQGFMSSLPLYMHISDLFFIISSILLIPVPFKQKDKRAIISITGIILALFYGYLGQYSYLRNYWSPSGAVSNMFWNILSRDARQNVYAVELTYPTKQTSILHLFGYDLLDGIEYLTDRIRPYQISDNDQYIIKQFYDINTKVSTIRLDGPLIVVIVESFESWVFNNDIMPNLSKFCKSHNVFYADKVKSQVRGGMSADGQMLINTGLLPTLEGAACFRYPRNTYPGIMHQIDGKSAVLVPHNIDVWNQKYMSEAYGYDTTIQVNPIDTILFQQVIRYIHEGYNNVQVLTMSTHTPFVSGASLSNLQVSNDIPELRRNYMKAFNTLDYGLNILLKALDTDSLLQNATVVITGDHTVLDEPAYCPLIVCSPEITESIYYTDDCYQMDIYPTLLDILDLETNWKGFGLNLHILPHTSTHTRRAIRDEKALELSDKMHRANYFGIKDNEK